MSRLTGKIALVTGGSSGLGLATAKLFIDEGAFVFLTGRRQAEVDAAAASLGPAARAIRGDIALLSDLESIFDQIGREQGQLDILFANAGIGEFLALPSVTEEHVDRILAVNVKGTLFTVQKALPLMPEGASIVLNGSMVSVQGTPAFGVYAASKAAIRSFARTWIVDLKSRRIRVNVVSPGIVPTAGHRTLGLTDQQLEAYYQAESKVIPLGRVGTADEIARAVLFLASDDSSYVNGVELFVDGGFSQI